MRLSRESLVSGVLVLSALAVAASVVRREFWGPYTERPASDPNAGPVFIDDWSQFLQDGILVGDSSASVTILEFTDLECPFCRRFHEKLMSFLERSNGSVAYVFVHYPLPMHRNAMPAARAAECAHAQGAFAPFIDAVFRSQDSIGIKPWTAFALAVGVADTTEFARCFADETLPRIERGQAIATSIQAKGTPTVIINGWLLPVPPYDSLADIVARILAGTRPYVRPRG